MPPMTGRVIAGRYNLQHPIGRGAMGVVWRARDQLLDRDVAVKEVVISAHIGPDERHNAYQRTLREARTAARLSHRGVVAVYDVAEEDGRPWIIMELVPSRSLDQMLTAEGRMQPLRVGRIGQQLLAALAAAHGAGVLHRDVKPSNVLIATDRTPGGWDERAVLTDFGIAQFEGDPRLTQTGMVMGSPGFTAPERIRGGDATSASDLWSLGATLYAAVEGHGPYESRGGAITTMTAIINEDAPLAPHAGRLSPLIAALLRRDPSSRPSAATAARMFAQVLPRLGEAVAEPQATPHPPTMRSAYVQSPPVSAPPVSAASVTAREDPAPEPVVEQAREPAAEPAAAPADGLAASSNSPAAGTAAAGAAGGVAAGSASVGGASAGGASAGGAAAGSASAGGAAGAAALAGGDAGALATAVADESAESEPAAVAVADAESDEEQEPATPVAAGTPAVAAAAASDAAEADPAQAIPAQAVSAQSAPPQPVAGEPVTAEPAGSQSISSDVASGDQDQAGSADSMGYRPTQIAIPVARAGAGAPPRPAQPKPLGPTFTASSPADRIAARPASPRPSSPTPGPSSSPAGARPPYGSYQQGPTAGPAQSGYSSGQGQYSGATDPLPPLGSTTPLPPSSAGYAGPSQAYPDLSRQYVPGGGGGRGERRRGPGRLIALIAVAVVLAIAIGVGAAFALGHNNSETAANTGNTGTGTGTGTVGGTSQFNSVNALNDPTAVPANWTAKSYPASDFQSDVQAGFSVGLPPNWTAQTNGDHVDLYGPGGTLFEIDMTPHAHKDNMVTEAKYVAQQSVAQGRLPGYTLQTVKPVTVLGTKGSIWQFYWQDNGVTDFVDDIFFVKPTPAGSQSYALYLRAPKAGWKEPYLPMFESILHTFRTVPAS